MSKWRDIAIQCLNDEAKAVTNLIPNLDDDFEKAIELILNCKGKVVITGVGKSGHVGAKIAATILYWQFHTAARRRNCLSSFRQWLNGISQ